MSDLERGAYAPPTDPPLSFDPRQPVRGSRPLPFTLIVSILVLAALVAVIFVFYRSGVRQAGQAPQVVGTPVGGMKSAAPAEAQPQDPAAGLQIYQADAEATAGVPAADPQFTSPPETPQPRPTPTATAPAAVQPAPVQPAPVQSAPVMRPGIPATAAKVPTPAPKVEAKVAVAPPVQKPTSKPAAIPPKVAASAPAAVSGVAAVQIGAVSSTDLADRTWREAVAVAPGLAAGKGKGVEKIEKNGGILYRTAVTGFASRADAQAFCAKLQAAGKSCFVR